MDMRFADGRRGLLVIAVQFLVWLMLFVVIGAVVLVGSVNMQGFRYGGF